MALYVQKLDIKKTRRLRADGGKQLDRKERERGGNGDGKGTSGEDKDESEAVMS